jgi:hypothetical protein
VNFTGNFVFLKGHNGLAPKFNKMKRPATLRLFILLGFAALAATIHGQDLPYQLGLEPAPLTPDELFVLANVPLIELPEAYKGPNAPLLPVSVDNSTQPYFRPITSQTGYECGQSAGVAFNFTYEIDRLRSVSANTTTNQYPTHFVWDFLNSGNNYVGASFFDSWEIVRACGTMNVSEYGGTLGFGGYKRWISGYDVYYSGMHNRLTAVKGIRCDDTEGLQTLKYWLYDHLEGSTIGGVCNIYGQYFGSVGTTLPPGTPEAGKFVQTYWGGSPSHAWTIVGYNDSIRFDFNNDGQYTNNLDINGDGYVNMHDWEIGGVKIANGYAGTGWCNSGFCYTMYKCLADNIGSGGVWNHTTYTVDVKATCEPKLTMKVVLKHTSREKIKVTVGTSTDLSALYPTYVQEYPIFTYQGGNNYMQGGTAEADKTIEFGLDLTPLLSKFATGQAVKYFLQVQETDPGNSYEGEIVSCALIDYTTGTPVTTNFASTNVPLYNNDITRISVNHATNFSKPTVNNASLPMGTVYQPYSCQMNASGGTSPYLWDIKLEYPETTNNTPFPSVTAQQLTLTNNNSGYAIKNLDFPLPFYKKSLTKLYIYADGYILFDDQPYTYPYLVDKKLLFKQTSIISPFMADLNLYSSQSDGVWYEGDATYAIIRWKASINGMAGSSSVNFAVKIYPNGTIEYYYGTMNFPAGMAWTGGVSGGDNINYQFSMLNGTSPVATNTLDKFNSCAYPIEMTLSEDGLFTGTPQYAYQNLPITFRVTDNNGISNTKVLNFSVNGLVLDYTIMSGGDTLIEFGETAQISISLQNIGQTAVSTVYMWLTETDPFITLLDSIQNIGTINPGQTLNFPNAFSFLVSPNVPDEHAFPVTFHLTSSQQSYNREVMLLAHAPDLAVSGVAIGDGDNQRLDPGETAQLLMTLSNYGSAPVHNMGITITPADPLITVNTGTASIPLLDPDSSYQLAFSITASPEAPFEHLYAIRTDISAPNNFSQSDTAWLLSGEIIEDFESATFDKFNWEYGLVTWDINDFQPWEGEYCAKSGWTFDNATAELRIPVIVLQDGEISFMRKTSCEDDPNGANYDHLAFTVDGYELGRWDGVTPWTLQTYPVTRGFHIFRWLYQKDASIAANLDCVWIDFVTFPPFTSGLPAIAAAPQSFVKTLDEGQSLTDQLTVTNTGGGILNYTIMVFDTSANKLTLTDNLGGSAITCNATSYVPGQAFSWNFTVANNSSDNEYIEEIRMDFPQGAVVSGATNFSGGSLGDLVYDGTTGNGPTIYWHGETASGTGVIKPGESATASVSGTIDESQTYDVFVVYSIRGDSTGALPHSNAHEIRIANDGLSSPWLSFSSNTGDLFANESEAVTVTFDATSISDGDYAANILVRDLYNNIITVPVTLHVNDATAIPDGQAGSATVLFNNYPNPFSSSTTIRYSLDSPGQVRLDIYDLGGRSMTTLVDNYQRPGEYRMAWNGRDRGGRLLPGGIYECRLTAGNYNGCLKIIIIR